MLKKNEDWVELDDGQGRELGKGLFVLVAWSPRREPRLIGTGFLAKSNGNYAWAVTALHNMEGVADIQFASRSHATYLFKLGLEDMSIDRFSVRAFYYTDSGELDACTIGFALCDRAADLAVLLLLPQDKSTEPFRKSWNLQESIPRIGDLAGAVGFSGLNVIHSHRDGKGFEEIVVNYPPPSARIGRIVGIHSEGFTRIRRQCFEVSFPSDHGMSGGPAFLLTEAGLSPGPFALISSAWGSSSTGERSADGTAPNNTILSPVPMNMIVHAEQAMRGLVLHDHMALKANPELRDYFGNLPEIGL